MLPILPVSEFRFAFNQGERTTLPAYAGSAWRGAFGHALKRTVCVVRDTPCGECMLYRSCAYPYIFETPPPPDTAKMRHYTNAPHPFVLGIGPRQTTPDYQLGLTLFGRGHQYLPYVIHALDKAGKLGLGARRQVFDLTGVAQAESNDGIPQWHTIFQPGKPLTPRAAMAPPLPPVPQRLRIDIETPLRLRNQEHYITPETFSFADFFGPLLRRISLLTYFHTDTPLETDFAGLTQQARLVRINDASLRWWDWTRYSTRQNIEMQMGGLLGSFSLEGAEVADFWPYLWLGQWTLAGKAATMGLGRYRIHASTTMQGQ